MSIEDELYEMEEVDTSIVRRYINGGYIPTSGLVLQLCEEIDALRTFAGVPVVVTGACAVCGVTVTHPQRGRRRKYCPPCAEGLRHRTPKN